MRKFTMKRVTDSIGLAGETVGRIPLAEICGSDQVLIENHRCIVGYTEREILVRVCFGCYRIVGENLVLRNLKKDQLVICGRIESVALIRGG